MSDQTNIAWANFTASPWLICSMVSAGCKNCYAMLLAARHYAKLIREAYRKAGYEDWRTLPLWGPKAPRVLTKSFWVNVPKWNRAAGEGTKGTQGTGRPRMFMSMVDWLDDFPAGIIDQEGKRLDPVEVRARLMRLIYECSNLDWLLLTKRIEAFRPLMLDVYHFLDNVAIKSGTAKDQEVAAWIEDWLFRGKDPFQIWMGVSVEDQKAWDARVAKLVDMTAIVRWVSLEPLLERVSMRWLASVDWVVVGGESGPGRRDPGVAVFEDAVEQCVAAGVPVFCKQDCHQYPGMRGRIREEIWKRKEFPEAIPF